MIYFDNAATSFPKPQPVISEVYRCITSYCGNPGRSAHALAMASAEKIYECRERVAKLFHAPSPENVIFMQNATYALNAAIKTRIKQGSEILISDMEHNSVFRPVKRLEEDKTASFKIYSGYGNVGENIEKLISKNTDMLICNHVSNVCGRRMPLKTIGEICHRRGIYFIVDASQSAGHTDIDFSDIKCDALCAPGHKGLYGIQGSGILILKNADGLREYTQGGSGSNSMDPFMPKELPERYEAGTLATPAIASLCEGVKFISEMGFSEIESYENELLRRTFDILSSVKGTGIYGNDSMEGSVLSFNIDGIPSYAVAEALSENGICVRSGLHCSPLAHKVLNTGEYGAVRLSFGVFNKLSELETFYKVLRNIADFSV